MYLNGLDELDQKIIQLLIENARISYSDIGEKTIAEDREDSSFIWENYFDEETNINEYYLSVFVRAEDGRYDKYEEEHFQRGYTLNEVKKAVEKSGLKLEKIYEAFTDNEGTE